MKSSPVTVSVLIPTFNYANYLDEAISSALNQTYKDFELIIVDDKSSDNTDEIVSKYLHDKRVSYFKNAKNLGLVRNFNKCLEYAKGKYIKYLLADDKFHPQLLEKFVDVMDKNPGVSLVTSHNRVFGHKDSLRKLPFEGRQDGREMISETIRDGNFIGEPTVVMFRKAGLEVGEFSDKYTCLVDLNMWHRLLMIGDCYIVPEALSYFRSHSKQASSKTNVQNWIDEYNFYNDIHSDNIYGLRPDQLDLSEVREIVKDRAVHCSRGMYRILPKYFEKKYRSLVHKAFKIALKEQTIIQGFLRSVKKIF